MKRMVSKCLTCKKEFRLKSLYLLKIGKGKYCGKKCYGKAISLGIKKPNSLGKKRSEQTKQAISNTLKNDTETLMRLKRISYLGAQAFYKGKPTSLEQKLYAILNKEQIKYEPQKLIHGKFLVDAYIPSMNTIIEVDGNYWHSLDRIKKKDKAENAYLAKCGFNLLRISENEIDKFTMKEVSTNIH